MTIREILLVEDDEGHASLAMRALERSDDIRLTVVTSIAEARQSLRHFRADLVLADLHLPDGSGLALLDQPTPVVVQTSHGDEAQAVAAMKGGAVDYFVKSPELYRDLPIIIERALNTSRHLVERRRAEQSLRESDERFRQLASSIPEAFWLLDVDTRQVVYASPAWESVYGTVPHTWEGRLRHVHPDDVVQPWTLGPTDGETFRVIEGKNERWVEERRFWITDAEGRRTRLSVLAADITRRRELEASLLHAQKMQAVGQLAGGVAHDFNNMLSAILSAAYELSQENVDPELCELIISASTRASELTRNLLSFSRRARADRSPVDLQRVLREVVSLLRRSLPPDVSLVTSFEPTAAAVLGDAAQLQSTFLNLGINARDALGAHGGEIALSMRLTHLDDGACRLLPFELTPGPFVEVCVRDNGAGIAPETLPHIFEPFFTTKARDAGTGLGLAAVYGTVLEHKGAVTVRSRPGEGAEFVVLLPLSEAPRPAYEPATADRSGRGQVLLVDDEPLLQRAGRRLLERLGYEVVTRADGEQGWAVFQAQREDLVAVVSDISMPRMGGRELVRRVREAAPGFPCVLCTGFAGAGAGDFPAPVLNKPFARHELADALALAIAAYRPPVEENHG